MLRSSIRGTDRFLPAVLIWFVTCASLCYCQRPNTSAQFDFERIALNPHSEFSACAVFDVNRDGHVDIYCGGYWYEGPDWQRHRTRDVQQIRGRYDDYANLPLDVNGDGWIDVVSANYRSQSVYWVENPREEDVAWQIHRIGEPGTSETGILTDVNADGQADILPNGTSFAAWYRRSLAEPSRFARVPLPIEVIGHGMGIGDLDADGLPDLITPRGWCKQWKAETESKWEFRGEFELHKDASIPIFVHDVDGDGDADVIWGRGHNVGVYWMEQRRSGEVTQWVKHAIDTCYSCAHHLLIADLNRDGLVELVAGRRFLGHDAKDPGEWMPLEVWAYTFQTDSHTWRSELLSWGGTCGFDLGAACADVDGDRDLDLVAATRGGLHLLVNHTNEQSTTLKSVRLPDGVSQVRYAASEPILDYREADQPTRRIASRMEWGYRRAQILNNMESVMGALPASLRRVDLDVRRESMEQCKGYRRIKLTYQSEPGSRVSAYLLIPDGVTQSAAAILCLHPTHALGKGVVCGWGAVPNRNYAHELAIEGFVCLAPDYPSFGDDTAYSFSEHPEYVSGTMKAIWNNVRAVDLLESLPEVDSDRIGCIGHSLGGHNSLFSAAFDMRLRAIVTSCGFTAFADYYDGNLTGWTSDRYMPRIRTDYGLDPAQMPFDFHEVLGAIAPRPVFVNAPIGDANFAVSGVKKTVARVQPVYDLFEAGDQMTVRYPAASHDFPDAVRREAYDWLKRSLSKK